MQVYKSLYLQTLLMALLYIGFTTNTKAQPAAPSLVCVNLLLSGDVALTWNPGTGGITCGATFDSYNIYAGDSEAGPFNLLDNVTDPLQTTFTDIVSNTTDPVYYYVTTQCGSLESDPSQVVSTTLPVAPVITNVTALDNDIVQINWQPSSSPETYGYTIYRADENNNFVEIGTVTGSDVGFYQDLDAEPGTGPQAYKIAAFDSCSLEAGPDNGIVHQTVFLTAQNDSCDNVISLNWTGYQGWDTDLEGYEILEVDENNVVINNVAMVDAATNTYDFELPEGQNTVCLRVVATRTSGPDNSFSNFVCASVVEANGPQSLCITNASVLPDNSIQLNWDIDLSNSVFNVEILRSRGDTIDLEDWESVDITSLSPSMITIDSTANTERYPYSYQILHLDQCNRPLSSNIVQTVALSGRDQFNLTNGLDWSAFYLTGANVLGYTLYRSPIGSDLYEPIADFSANEFTYQDPIDELDNTVPGFCYRIEALYEFDCEGLNPIPHSSFSNIICITQTARIFVPNAFAPEGINNIFIPVILYPNDNSYRMTILSRWGEVMFETTDINQGWDGTHKGELAPQGVYAYRITMQSDAGFNIERKGTVMLMRR